jgi:hypothetical protein
VGFFATRVPPPQNPKSWISKAQSAFEIQLLGKIGRLCDLLKLCKILVENFEQTLGNTAKINPCFIGLMIKRL